MDRIDSIDFTISTENLVQNYLDILPEDITILDIKKRKIHLISTTNISNILILSKFTYLQELICSHNYIKILPELPKNLVKLDCSFNELKFLPELPEKLSCLVCNDNFLTHLPILPKNLHSLYCSFNKLVELPVLPLNLIILHCSYNKIINIPILPESIKEILYTENLIGEFLGHKNSLNILRKQLSILYNLKYTFYLLIFKEKFRYILWYKIREPRLQVIFHPTNIKRLLDEKGYDLDIDEIDSLLNKL